MPIVPSEMSRTVKKRLHRVYFDDSATTLNLNAWVDPLCWQQVIAIEFLYTVAGDTGTHQAYLVGTFADTDQYFTGSASNSKAAGDVESKTVLNPTMLLPPGTALVVQRANTSAATNTTELYVQVWTIPIESKDVVV